MHRCGGDIVFVMLCVLHGAVVWCCCVVLLCVMLCGAVVCDVVFSDF